MTGTIGDGKGLVSRLDDAVRIRTDSHRTSAL
jgi:nitrogen regulatory protein PII